MAMRITNARIITPFQTIEKGEVHISDDGKIAYVGPAINGNQEFDQTIDAGGDMLAPGLIDIHTHGGFGVAFGLSDLKSSLQKYSEWVVQTGVTGFLITIAAPDVKALIEIIQTYIPILEESSSGAQALGLHLEGPYLNPEKKGAFNLTWLQSPNVEDVYSIIKAGKGWIKQVTIAPELENSKNIAKVFKDANIVVALGHSNADYETASNALRGNFSHVTHCFNTQSNFNHREPGVIGAILASDHITAELIADEVHVHPGAMKILFRCLGKDRIILITDAMPGAGLPDGLYNLIGQEVIVKDGHAKLPDGTIAGSTAKLIDCVENIYRDVTHSINDALQAATSNPSKLLGLQNNIGTIQEKMDANIIIFNKEFEIRLVLIRGNIVYEA